jgi:alginate O-acetyltransferase complex protein AlgI
LYRNLIIVFLFSGFWHGASWNFIMWGAYHGLFLVLERLFLLNVYQRLGKFISVPVTFIILVTGWVLFRNTDWHYAMYIIKKMYVFDVFDGKFVLNNDFIFMLVVGAVISFFAITPKTKQLQDKLYGENFSVNTKWLALAGGVVLFYISLSYVSALDFNPFIYFRF